MTRVGADLDESFQFGIEEEYFLCDEATGALVQRVPQQFFNLMAEATGGLAKPEYVQSQIEVATRPSVCMKEAKNELEYQRSIINALARFHKMMIISCGTHPSSQWRALLPSDSERYKQVTEDLQCIGLRSAVCGLHIHVEVHDVGRRIELMNKLIPYLPIFVALSSSSPFWQSHDTGLQSYRSAAYDEMPRSGTPELFKGQDDYDSYVDALIKAGAIKDSSYIWWMVRPSQKYPTLELRAPDACTILDDTMALTALYRCLVRHLYRCDTVAETTRVDRALAVENKWRAQRYGTAVRLASRSGGEELASYLERTLFALGEDAEALGCKAELAHCLTILERGTSADLQRRVYNAHRRVGNDEALVRTIEWIGEATVGSNTNLIN